MPFFKKKSGSGHSVFEERFERHKKLGAGGFSEVYEVTRKSDSQKFAAKIIERKRLKDNMGNLELEIGILKVIDHQNIVKLIDHIEEKK